MYNTVMDVTRMYRIMMMLIAGGRATRNELAEKFEMSTRSVQRYVTALMDAGIPIVSESGKNGGYSIPSEYRLSSVLVGEEDVARIKTCLTALESTFKDDLTREILDKLSALSSTDEPPALVVDFDNWNGEGASEKEEAMNAAIRNSVTVEMQYTDKSGMSTDRLFDPYCIALKEGVRYVYGKCHIHGDYRLFRLARIKKVALTERSFVRGEDADVKRALMIDGGTTEIVISFDESARAGVEEWLGSSAVTEGEPPTARASVYGGGELIRKILSFGAAVKVVSPESLRLEVAAEAARIARNYEKEESVS